MGPLGYTSSQVRFNSTLAALWFITPGSNRPILIIGYTAGIQIWDCSDLASVSELLNLSNQEWSHEHAGRTLHYSTFVHAAILPSPHSLLGILLTTPDSSSSAFFIYSLKNHQIIHKIALSATASTFESNNHFIVIVRTQKPIQYLC